MPTFERVPLGQILEPEIPARTTMDDTALQELQDSMARDGLLSPIALKPNGELWEIECGHRRFICAKRLGWVDIPALKYAQGEINEGAAKHAENRFREDLNAAEEAIWFAQERDKYALDEAGMCARFHVSPDYLADRLRLLRGDEKVFHALQARQINFSVARELNKCPDEAHRLYLLDVAIQSGYGAHRIADFVRQWRVNNPPASAPAPVPAAAEPAPPVQVATVCCHFCWGAKDPYNLVSIMVHRWELERIEEVLREMAKA